MRKDGAIILGLVILGISLSGLIGVGAASINRCTGMVACPLNAGIFATASFFNSGFSGGASQVAFLSIFLAVFLIVTAALFKTTIPDFGSQTYVLRRIERNDGRIGALARKLMSWRSLLEMSPSAA